MIRAAVIGVGNMGSAHLRVYSELKNCKVVACADFDTERLAEAKARYGCHVYRDYAELLAREEVDVISIVVPTSFHLEVAKCVTEAGIPFLLEKPIASSVAEADLIWSIAREKGIPFLVGHIERFNPAVCQLEQLIKEGVFGDILAIQSKRVGLYPHRVTNTNVLIDVAIHDVEIINHLFSTTPDDAWISGGSAFGKCEDYVEVLMRYGNASGVVQANWVTPVKIRKLYVTGTMAYGELDYIHQSLILYRHQQATVNGTYEGFQRASTPEPEDIPVKRFEPLKAELLHMLDVASKHSAPAVTPKQAIDALRLTQYLTELLRARKLLEIGCHETASNCSRGQSC